MTIRTGRCLLFLACLAALGWGAASAGGGAAPAATASPAGKDPVPASAPSLRATWDMPAACSPFDPPRVKDLKEELRQTGYRLVVALHPDEKPNAKGEYPPRHLYLINADGSGLRPIAKSDREENTPRTSPDGRWFTYNYGDFLMDARTMKSRQVGGGYVWAPDSRRTVSLEKNGIIYTDMETGKASVPVKVKRRVDILDMSADARWFTFELRNYQGSEYNICFMAADGTGDLRKLPNHPIKDGECHPAFSPDGKWICWNGGQSLAVRRFDPSLPDGTEGKITTLPKEKCGQDPCGRWSHDGRYIAFVRIPHSGSWKVHAPICIVRVADGESITLSPPGLIGHHWDYDWLPPAQE